ncbi:gene transfer agent family protein [Rubellimicrobium rubrum]|uniref:Gene transfer agent family protein n=1 Tax=Rubellimicrobium rubrum TaxID=2585369 RepID=A0A5C4N6R4_9RHOB|nr:gene transfer agent family protein [Rubellimicrobium rubrum]TNC52799.1 gene transfer agent family protein [Rubellimicrobium rubrum]
MANLHAGEVEILVDGVPRTAKLTLGALAELEASLGGDTLVALVARFESGDVSSRDVMALLVAGLRGGGWRVTSSDLLTAEIAGGPLGAVRAAAELLARAFAVPG